MAHWGGLFTSSTGSYGTNFDRTGAPTWLWMAFTGASCSATYATRPPEKLCEFSASLLNWYDRQTYELNVTSLALGIVIAICVVVVLGGIAHEFASRIRRRRHIEAEIDRDILYWPTTTPVTPPGGVLKAVFPRLWVCVIPACGLGIQLDFGNAGQKHGSRSGIQLSRSSFRPWPRRSSAELKARSRSAFRAWKCRPG
jgi:hypothetical protein